MIWILLAVHLIGLVGYSLILRVQAHKGQLHPWVLATILQSAITIPALIVAIFIHPDFGRFTTESLLLSAAVVGLDIGLFISTVKALQYLEASTFVVIYSLKIVIVTLLAIVLISEPLSYWQILGGLSILASIFMLRQKGNQTIVKRGIIWGIAATIIASLVAVLEKRLIEDVGVFTAGPVVVLTGSIIMWSVVIARRYPVPVKILMTRQMVSLMCLRILALWGFVLALAAGAQASVATYISSLSVIIVAVLGIQLLGERDYLQRKLVAVGLAAIGTTAILIGQL
jgi:drug/metabolite transporter (DMT)-like permease